MKKGTLYVVATPIGNLGDISYRAITTLASVSRIFCEDTRITRRLLQKYEIDTPVTSYHVFSGITKIRSVIDQMNKGFDVALVSDAGTPTISDPGVRLVSAVRNEVGPEYIVTVPGASAVVAALSISGVPASSFTFLGFLPKKKGKRKILEDISNKEETIVFYESPHRIVDTLGMLSEILDDSKEVVVLRELTKIYESLVYGTPEEVHEYFVDNSDKVKGEFVVVIGKKRT